MTDLIEVARQCRIEYVSRLHDVSPEEAAEFSDRLDLVCHCALVTQFFFQKLVRSGHKPLYMVAHNHVYLQVDGWNYDLSASQFSNNFPPIYAFQHEAWPFGPVLFRTDNTAELWDRLVADGWPDEQIYPE